MSVLGVRDLLDENPIVGERRLGGKRFWTTRELKIVQDHFPNGGVPACLPLLPGRTAAAIYCKAGLLELHSSSGAKDGIPRQRWYASAAIDDVIRRVYPRCTTKGDVGKLARDVGRPRWWVSKRAIRLGLSQPRFKALPWTVAEDEIILASAHSDPQVLKRRLKMAGFERTEIAIVLRLKRAGADREDPNHYTARGLADLLGIDSKAVATWIAKGWLKGKRRGTERTEAQHGDQWWIKRSDVRAFVIENVAAVDLRKVDKFWFVDLLTGAA